MACRLRVTKDRVTICSTFDRGGRIPTPLYTDVGSSGPQLTFQSSVVHVPFAWEEGSDAVQPDVAVSLSDFSTVST